MFIPCKKLPRLFLRLMLTLLLSSALSLAASEKALSLGISEKDNAAKAWSINAESMNSLSGGSILEAVGNVEMRMGQDYILADFARYYPKTEWIYLSGNVRVSMGNDTLTADSAEFNLKAKSGWLTNGVIFLAGPHLYIEGADIIRHSADLYTFKNATITMCDTDTPAWSMAADSAVVEIDGYAELWGTSFRVLDTSVMYSPFMLMPTKNKRQTGLLMPQWGSSTEKGVFFSLPFFWAIDESSDLTLNETYMSKRGFMHGAAYRSQKSEDENFWLRLDYLNDDVRVTSDAGGEYSGDGLSRTNSSRWWLRGMTDARLPESFDPAWKLRATLDFVSDQDFIKQFGNKFSGFDQTRQDLFRFFSRDLREKDQYRESGLMLFREWQRASLYLTSTYTQNQTLGHGNLSASSDNTVQTLPELSAFWHKGRLVETLPLEFEGSFTSGYKYRRDGDKGFRTDFVPRVSLPLNSEYGSIITSADLRSTWYNTNVASQPGSGMSGLAERKSESNRLVTNMDIAASSEVFKVHNLGFTGATDFKTSDYLPKPGDSEWLSIKHAVVPRMNYRKRVADDTQKRNPYYDDYDRLRDTHELVYSIENAFTRKRAVVATRNKPAASQNPAGSPKPAHPNEPVAPPEKELYYSYDYLKFLRLKLEQTYDLEEAERNEDLDKYPRRPFRDWIAEAAMTWDGSLGFNSRVYWSPYSGDVTRWNQGVSLNVENFGAVYADFNFYNKVVDDYYTQRNDRLTQLRLTGTLNGFSPFYATFYYDVGIDGAGEDALGLELDYNHQCFTLAAIVDHDEKETSVSFTITFAGFSFK
jgi:LPS-assembly protein